MYGRFMSLTRSGVCCGPRDAMLYYIILWCTISRTISRRLVLVLLFSLCGSRIQILLRLRKT